MTPRDAVVIGVGNGFRRDDGAGPAVVEALRGRVAAALAVSDGEPARLIGLWGGAPLAVVIDAVRAEPPCPGRVHEMVMDETGTVTSGGVDEGGPESGGPAAGSHALGLGYAVELGRAVGGMPRTLHVLAIEGRDFGLGPGLTEQVEKAVAAVADRVAALLGSHGGGAGQRRATTDAATNGAAGDDR